MDIWLGVLIGGAMSNIQSRHRLGRWVTGEGVTASMA
jgi:hypothetical protein